MIISHEIGIVQQSKTYCATYFDILVNDKPHITIWRTGKCFIGNEQWSEEVEFADVTREILKLVNCDVGLFQQLYENIRDFLNFND